MRYINKSERCGEFDEYIKNKSSLKEWKKEWGKYKNRKIKLKLHQHLYREQGGLCVYCQQLLPYKKEMEGNKIYNKSHIEHIRPREFYKELTFVYCNLSVSCDGFDCEIEKTNEQSDKEFCGHIKDNEYYEEYFLNPFEVKDIENYFIYDDLTFEVLPKHEKGTDKFKKANYMIEILCLNHDELIRMRTKLVNDILKSKKKFDNNEKIFPPFYSMLVQLGLY